MDILALVPKSYANLMTFFVVMARISTLFSTFVLFRRGYVNSRVIIALAAILAFYTILLNRHQAINYDFFSVPLFIELAIQALLGFVMGFILNVLFEIFTAIGQIISTQIGFSMVTLIDPRFGAITPLTLFYNYTAIIIFLLLDGHLLTIKLVLESFKFMPVGSFHFSMAHAKQVIEFTSNIFSSSVSLSITVIITMLLTNLTTAVMSRFAPQFNIFSIGINITMVLGLVFIYLTFNIFIENSVEVFTNGFLFLQNIITR